MNLYDAHQVNARRTPYLAGLTPLWYSSMYGFRYSSGLDTRRGLTRFKVHNETTTNIAMIATVTANSIPL